MKVRIGFEIHEQLATRTKLFCTSPADYRDAEPNTNVCEICLGMPGAKPMGVNAEAVEGAVAIALMLNCEIVQEPVYILRKHYDYPDLPSGYQRTSMPIGRNGELAGVGIWEVHLEEDPGKYDPVTGKVDYNRSGVPLVEIVTAPDITSPEEARAFMRELVKVLQYSRRVRREGGTMRVDVNVSIEDGARVEIKNINSIRGLYRALKFEITRQKNLRRRGKAVRRETRAYIEEQMITRSMRTKETAEDYRYIPDPDLPPLRITPELVERIRRELPEAPHQKLARFVEQYRISRDDAWAITSEPEMADAFEQVCTQVEPARAAAFFRHIIKKTLNYHNLSFAESGIRVEDIVQVLRAISEGRLSQQAGELVMRRVVEGERAAEVLREMSRVDEQSLVSAVEQAIHQNPGAVEDYRRGKQEAINYLVGQVMRITKGRADAARALELLRERLS